MVAAGFLLYTLYCLMVGFAPNMILMYAAQIIGGFANAVLTSVLMASCIAYVAPEKKSTAMGLYQAIYGIGMTIGPVIMGSFVDWSGYGGAFSLFALCALAAAIGALIFHAHGKTNQNSELMIWSLYWQNFLSKITAIQRIPASEGRMGFSAVL